MYDAMKWFRHKTEEHSRSVEFERSISMKIPYNDIFIEKVISKVLAKAGYNTNKIGFFNYYEYVGNLWVKLYIHTLVIEDTILKTDDIEVDLDTTEGSSMVIPAVESRTGHVGRVVIQLDKPIVAKLDKKRIAHIKIQRDYGRTFNIDLYLNLRHMKSRYNNSIKLGIRAVSDDVKVVRFYGYIKGSIRKRNDFDCKIRPLLKEFSDRFLDMYREISLSSVTNTPKAKKYMSTLRNILRVHYEMDEKGRRL